MEKVTKLRIVGFASVVCIYIGTGVFSYAHTIITDYNQILIEARTIEVAPDSGSVIGVAGMEPFRIVGGGLAVIGAIGFLLMMSTDDKVALRKITYRYRLQTSVVLYFISICVGLGLLGYAIAQMPEPVNNSLFVADVVNSMKTDTVRDYIYYNIWHAFGVSNISLGVVGYAEIALRPDRDVGFRRLDE